MLKSHWSNFRIITAINLGGSILKNSKVVHDKLFCKANDAENPAKRSAQIPAVDVFLAVSPWNQKLHSSLALQG